MDIRKIISSTDHTLLSPTAKWEDVQILCDEAMAYGTASICIPPCYVQPAAQYVDGQIAVCTVIGFPHGNCTTATKLFAAKNAAEEGATEIDMVINLGYLKDKQFDKIFSEISGIRAIIEDKAILKVIVETSVLTQAEKVDICLLVEQTGAEFIKTSTGFNGGGATAEDISLFKKHSGKNMQIKASGGISTLADAWTMLECGATRIGSSRIIRLVQDEGIPPTENVFV